MTTKPNTEAKNALPAESIRLGNLNLAVWKRYSTEGVEFENYTINRAYYDEAAKTWKNTQSYGIQDLKNLRDLLDVVIQEHNQSRVKRYKNATTQPPV